MTRVTSAVVRYTSMLDILQHKEKNGLILMMPDICPVVKHAVCLHVCASLKAVGMLTRGMPSTMYWGAIAFIQETKEDITIDNMDSLSKFLLDGEGIKIGSSLRAVARRIFAGNANFKELTEGSGPLYGPVLESLKTLASLHFGET
jgi:hypothetical protein